MAGFLKQLLYATMRGKNAPHSSSTFYIAKQKAQSDDPQPQIRTSREDAVRFSREFAMPNSETFSIPPVAALLDRWLANEDVVVDPFARNSKRGTITNDLNPATDAEFHLLAEEFVQNHVPDGAADRVLFDPPYSPRQIAECYQQIGRKASTEDTQNARLYKRVKDGLDRMLKPEGIAICCGWNSLGFGLKRGYEMLEILLVTHGGAHNDTIVTVERKLPKLQRLFEESQ